MIGKTLENTGEKAIFSFQETYAFVLFISRLIFYTLHPKSYSKKSREYIIEQIYLSGVKKLPSFIFLAFVLGSILILIAIIFAIKFSLVDEIGTLLVLFVVNEFSPMFTTLFFVLVYGLSTHENSSNENSIYEVYVPQLLNSVFLIPLMSLLFATIMLISGCLVSIFFLEINLETYKDLIIDSMSLQNVLVLLAKAFICAFVVMTIPLYYSQKFKKDKINLRSTIIRILIIMLVVLTSIEIVSILLVY